MPTADPSTIFGTIDRLDTEQARSTARASLDLVLHYQTGSPVTDLADALGISRTSLYRRRTGPPPDTIWRIALHLCDNNPKQADRLFPLFYDPDPMAAVRWLQDRHPERFAA